MLLVVAAVALGRPSRDIIDIETDDLEHEQEGIAGRAVEGEYSWVAPNGEEIKIKYVADHLGFRVVDSENVLPEVDDDLDDLPELDDDDLNLRDIDDSLEDDD